jgi:hypothetical protein
MEGHPRFCLGCDYHIDGLPEPRCPECGRKFDPADPLTVNEGRPLGDFGRWMLKSAVGAPLVQAAVAAIVTFCWAASPDGVRLFAKLWGYRHVPTTQFAPPQGWDGEGWATVSWICAVMMWVGHLVLMAVGMRLYRQPARRVFAGWPKYFLLPLFMAGFFAFLSALGDS